MQKVSVLHFHHDLCGTMFVLSCRLFVYAVSLRVVVNTLEL